MFCFSFLWERVSLNYFNLHTESSSAEREFDQKIMLHGSFQLLSASNTTNHVLFPQFLYVAAFTVQKFL